MIEPAAAPAIADAPTPRGAFTPAGWLVLAALSALYLWFLAANFAPWAGGSDSSGYFNSARLLAHGEFSVPPRVVPGLEPGTQGWNSYAYEPLGFIYSPGTGRLSPTYPIGLPLHLLAAAAIVGWSQSALVVVLAAALAGGLLMAATARECGLSWPWAVGGACLLCASPLYVFFALQPMTDVLATTWSLAAVYLSLRARRGSARWALGAGACVAVAVLVRPTNLLILLPVACLLGARWRGWLALAVGGLPGAILLGYYNQQVYGSVLTTGYGDIGPLLRLGFLPHNSAHMARWLPQLLSPLVLLALPFPWLARGRPRLVVLLGLWILVFAGFYAFYFHTGETWWYLRFILPAFPPLLVAALWTGRRLLEHRRHLLWRAGLPLIALATGLFYQIRLARDLHVATVHGAEIVYPETAGWLKAHAPANAIIMTMQTSGALFYYTPFTLVRWDMMEGDAFPRLCDLARKAGREIYAPLFPFEQEDALRKRLGGQWEKVADVRYASIWRLREAP